MIGKSLVSTGSAATYHSLQDLAAGAGLPVGSLDAVEIRGSDPIFPMRYRANDAGAAAIAATGAAAAELWRLKTGRLQHVRVDAQAAAAAMRSARYLRIDGVKPKGADKLTGFYALRDGRWLFLHCNFPNLQARNCEILGVPQEPGAVAAAIARWDGPGLEEKIFGEGGVCAFVRSEEEWLALPHVQAMIQEPLLEVIRIGEAPPEPLPPGDRPLSGIRVLDLTRVLAGPTAARTLAEHGADVMRITREDLADSGPSDFDTNIGKLCAHLDLRDPARAQQMRELVRTGDVFSQSYRPGALARLGFGPEDLARLRPGIVYVTLDAWGFRGPWRDRRGYETVLQSANGMAWQGAAKPAFLPVSAQDYITGYLAAFGAMVALARRVKEGGSWMVRVSLARTGHWIRQHGLLEPAEYAHLPAELPVDTLAGLLAEHDSPAGRITHLRPAVQLSETPARWDRPAVPRGYHPARWPQRP